MDDLEQHWIDALDQSTGALNAISNAHGLPRSELGARRERIDRERAWVAGVDWSRFRTRGATIALLERESEPRSHATVKRAA
jgi:hypothetical protein